MSSLSMNSPDFTNSSVIVDSKNFAEELHKVFEVMHVVDAKHVELPAYQPEGDIKVWYDQWKKGKAQCAPILSWVVFEEAFMGHFFPH